MSNPKISIITPVYNVEKYLKNCIESVINQDFKDFEMIIVDDGSTDSCPEIINKYTNKDSRIKVIHKENEGTGAARNLALEKAKGDYVLMLDSDDSLLENALSKMYEKITKNDAEVLVFNVKKWIEEDNAIKNWAFALPYYEMFAENVFSSEQIKEKIYKVSAFPFKIYKRSAMIEYGFKYTLNRLSEDNLPFFMFFAKAKRIMATPDYYVQYTIRPDSACRTTYDNVGDVESTYFQIAQAMEQDDIAKNYIKYADCYRIRTSLSFLRSTIENLPVKRQLNCFKVIKNIYNYIEKNHSETLEQLKEENIGRYKEFCIIKNHSFLFYFIYFYFLKPFFTKILRTIFFVKLSFSKAYNV